MTSYGATRKYKGAPGETVFISSSFGPVLSDCIYTISDELVGKFEIVLFSLNFPGAGESDRMTFVFDVIASGGERSSGWDELVGKFEKVLFSLNFPGAGESDRMTFVFDVIASGGQRSSGWGMRAAVCLGRASQRAAAAGRAR
ncbi:hypothetical protein DPX16_18903 [Anabarilius grahami]|uniref:Uncharacterized protein n=1 Tax=Anabarilius grahami TaxID=495550 RepID=A0A3N0YLM5_ANAGA|nr:hypothetical protein DPX16_18903 [Anabarilius grahami]